MRHSTLRNPCVAIFAYVLDDNNYITPISPHPTVPAGCPGTVLGYLNRAYAYGASAHASQNLQFESVLPPTTEVPLDISTPCIWEFFWQGYRFAKHQALSIKNQTAPSSIPKAPRVTDPEDYHSGKDKFLDFVAQLHLVFNSDPRRYNQERAKGAYAASYLRGAANIWFTLQLDKETGNFKFSSFSEFIKSLGYAFDDPDATTTAEQKLCIPRQGTDTYSTYYSKLISLMAILQLDGQAQILGPNMG
jgi:hypothetical protein